jgi:hypothetical protein
VSRREPVEVVVARNGTLGPLHLAIPVEGRWLAACRTPAGVRRELAGDRVAVWTQETGGAVWGEVRTCPDCLDLGEAATDTEQLAILAGWVRSPQVPRTGDGRPPRRQVSRMRQFL